MHYVETVPLRPDLCLYLRVSNDVSLFTDSNWRCIFRNAESPFSITGLQYRETYKLSVVAEGAYSESEPSPAISVVTRK